MNDSLILASGGFDLEQLAVIGMIVAVVLTPLMARRHTAKSSYYSGAFVLALCPFLIAGAMALIRIHSLIEWEADTTSYVLDRLRLPRQILVFGACLSGISIAIYSVIHAVRSRVEPMNPEDPILDERSA